MSVRILVAVLVGTALAGCSGGSTERVAGSDTTASDASGNRSKVVEETVTAPTTVPPATTTTLAHQPVQIVKSGFTQLSPNSIGTSYVTYAAVVRNPNSDTWIANSVDVNLTFSDSAGAVVKSRSESIAVILPGQTVAVGDSTQAESAAKLNVQVLVGRWQNTTQTNLGSFASEGVTTSTQRYGGLKTNATVTSRFANDIKSPKGVAVYYDSSGAIVGGAFTFIDFVPGGGKVGVEITSSQTVPNVATTEVYVAPTNLSLLSRP